jgi:predicted GNAT family acetyltransferase
MPSDPTSDVTISDAPERGRYEAFVDGALAGVLEYESTDDGFELAHTEVWPAFEGRGIAAAIVRFALDDARRRERRITVSCPYVVHYLARHPADRALLARRSKAAPAPSD